MKCVLFSRLRTCDLNWSKWPKPKRGIRKIIGKSTKFFILLTKNESSLKKKSVGALTVFKFTLSKFYNMTKTDPLLYILNWIYCNKLLWGKMSFVMILQFYFLLETLFLGEGMDNSFVMVTFWWIIQHSWYVLFLITHRLLVS